MKYVLAMVSGAALFFAGFVFAQILTSIHCDEVHGFVVGTVPYACAPDAELRAKSGSSASGSGASSYKKESI